MRGLDQLQQVRREGYRPGGLVSFSAVPMAAAAIVADPWDSPELADLRAFKGLSVVVYGRSFDVTDAWAQAIAAAGAFDVVLVLLDEAGIKPIDGTPAILKFHGEMLA